MVDSLTGTTRPLRIAIIGAGPGGLGATIAFRMLPDVDLHVFEGARELREIGAGITLKQNTWQLLRWCGAHKNLDATYNNADDPVIDIEHRNGRTGELLGTEYQPEYVRVERYKLQNALLKQIPPGLIQLQKKLAKLKHTVNGVSLYFEDGTVAEDFDLVIGADGIKSAVRTSTFPDHHISYTGKLTYRVFIEPEQIAHIKGIPKAPTFWYTPTTSLYTCLLREGKFEIVASARESTGYANNVSWGQEGPADQVLPHYEEYLPTMREILSQASSYLQFPLFGGPRLKSVISRGRIALLGDASHPLAGAFGSGAAFALEDAYCIKSALEYARSRGKPLCYALDLYDRTRSPHYERLYSVLDAYGRVQKELDAMDPPLPPDDLVRMRFQRNREVMPTAWIYTYNIMEVWKDTAAAEDLKQIPQRSEWNRFLHADCSDRGERGI